MSFVAVLYIGQRFGLFLFVAESILGDTAISCLELAWKCIDYGFSIVMLFEINGADNIHTTFVVLYIVFVAAHSFVFAFNFWFILQKILFYFSLEGNEINLALNPMAERNQKNIKHSIAVCKWVWWTEFCSTLGFFMEDLVGTSIIGYSVVVYNEELVSVVYIVGLLVQCVECGYSAGAGLALYRSHLLLQTLKVEAKESTQQ